MNKKYIQSKPKVFWTIAIVVTMVLGMNGCTQDFLDWTAQNPEIPFFRKAIIYGRVFDSYGNPIANAQVRGGEPLHTLTPVSTDENGLFFIPNAVIVKNKVSVKVEKAGYFTKIQSAIKTGNQTYIEVIMPDKNAISIASTLEQTVPIGSKASVTFAANSFVTASGNAYTGSVLVSSVYADPQSENFSNLMQGADLMAIDAAGQEQFLISYGAVAVELNTTSGEPLQLSPGVQATLRFQVPDDMQTTAPATIPLWYFDESARKWREEGQAALVGNEYIGQVSHFTWWNIDIPTTPNTFIKGLVKDCEGNILTGAQVKVGPMTVYSSETGEFQCNVPANMPILVSAKYLNTESNVIAITPLMSNELRIIDPIFLATCFYPASGIVQNCEGEPVQTPVFANFGGSLAVSISSEDGSFVLNGFSNVGTNINANILSGTDYLFGSVTIPPLTAPYLIPTPLTLCSISGGCIGGLSFVADGNPIFWEESLLSDTVTIGFFNCNLTAALSNLSIIKYFPPGGICATPPMQVIEEYLIFYIDYSFVTSGGVYPDTEILLMNRDKYFNAVGTLFIEEFGAGVLKGNYSITNNYNCWNFETFGFLTTPYTSVNDMAFCLSYTYP